MSRSKKHDVAPDVYAISQYTDVGYFRCRVFSDIEDDISPAQAAPPPHVQTLQPVKPLGHQLCRPKGQCLGYCLHPSAQHATAEKGQGLVGWCPADRLELENLTWKLELSIFKL